MSVSTTVIDITRPAPAWRGEWLGAFNGAAAMLPFVLTYGYLVFMGAGASAVAHGLTASVLSVVMAPLLMLLLSRSALPAAAPSATMSLILGALVVQLLADPAFVPGRASGMGAEAAAGLGLLVAAVAAAVVGAGALLLAMGALRAGRLVRFVPQPVLAGFMNGVAVLIVVSQLPAVLGLPGEAWRLQGLGALSAWQGAPLVVAAATALLAALTARRWPGAPAPLVALVVATLAVLGVQALGLAGPGAALERVHVPALSWPGFGAMTAWADADARPVLLAHLPKIAVTAILLGLIGGLETVLNVAAGDQLTGGRTDPDRELLALGCTNVVLGALGGLFSIYLRLRVVSTFNGGGRRRLSVVGSGVLLAMVFTLGLPLVRQVPVAVVGGIVVMLGWSLIDGWTRQMALQWWRGERSPDLQVSLLVVALVCAVTLGWGFVAGVGAGVAASGVIFIRALNRTLLRARYLATEMPSRRMYPGAIEAQLGTLRERIEVFELEGALFFGNVERLLAEADAAPAERGGARAYLVLDLRRVSTIDASGAAGLSRLRQQLLRQGVTLLLAGIRTDHRHARVLQAHGVPLQAAWVDADRAIEAAELALLDQAGYGNAGRHIEPAQNVLLRGLAEPQMQRVLAVLQRRELAPGDCLFEEGDPGHALFLLARGSISMVDRARDQRFISVSPGMCFGETAVLDSGGRTSDAVADVQSIVYALPLAALRDLEAGDPAIASRIYRNLATHLSQRLRGAAAAWRRAAG